MLYPLLLLLDDLEPGFVRSVVNPHFLLLACIGAATIAGPGSDFDRLKGRSRGVGIVCALAAAAILGVWSWWRIGGGALGVVVACITAVASLLIAWVVVHE